MSAGGRVHSNLPGQIPEQQMVMVPAGNTQVSLLYSNQIYVTMGTFKH